MKTGNTRILRLCIYPKDIMLLTGRSERYGRKLLSEIKKHFDKPEHQFVTIQEFCDYTGLDRREVEDRLV